MSEEAQSVVPVSAPPVQDEDVMEGNDAVTSNGYLETSNTTNIEHGVVSNYYTLGHEGDLFGQVSVVLGARGSDQSVLPGTILPYGQFCQLRDNLLRMLTIPAQLRVGYFEFVVDDQDDDTVDVVRTVPYEMVFLSQENVLAITTKLFQAGQDGSMLPVPVVTALV